ncbi:hypothetical protein [Flagellimonas zhangzhouensis]|uniref:CarboxypepD_reg-like domain-containing protein n=1 Tax=Flagellimonas zhangzhouensis TaxID=1073328 RepID=A0A1H2YUW6_9FLAO|nr:hypothetical protein [Allomuricauda zhangzhouensis]SDR05872.1 hypothetical protein SAMN05216294_3304 [Allomuricauda zhangzhouensis]SDX08946.1 hypothetical protein SAMN04487892_3189 [Allomuricauda zhangzhouensis]
MKKLILPFFLFLAHCALAQNGEKLLQGRVTSIDKDVVGVVVQNITTEQAVITDLDGNFNINVRVNDTLVFSAVHFLKKVLPVTEVLYNTSFVEVPLQEFVNQLQEVVVRPYNLSGDLSQDVNRVESGGVVTAESLGLPNAKQRIITQSERKLQTATGGKFNVGMILSPPIDPIINAITGRTKMLKNRVKVDKTYADTQRVQGYYADSLFVSTLKIPANKIDDFMYFCEVDEGFQAAISSQDKLRIWGVMVEKSRAYRENNGIE